MRTIISTVGTSLEVNAKRHYGLGPNDEIEAGRLADYLESADAAAASAETNSLAHMNFGQADRLVFVHSDTPGGIRCSAALCKYYRGKAREVETEVVASLGYESADFKNRGLRLLVSVLLKAIDAGRKMGDEVAINATGGFKAQIAYAVLIGQVRQAPVYYIHEQFRDVVEMPPIPVAWDVSLFADCRDFFDWLLVGGAPAECESRLKAFDAATVEKLRLMMVEEGGEVTLSPAGYVFYDAFEKRIEQAQSSGDALWLTGRARKALAKSGGQVRTRFIEILKELRDPRIRGNFTESKVKSDMRGYPTGHRNERALFADHPGAANAIVVYDLFDSHNDYETALDGNRLYTRLYDVTDIEPWTPDND